AVSAAGTGFAPSAIPHAASPVGLGGNSLHPRTPAPAGSGLPRAILPPKQTLGGGSGVGSEYAVSNAGFDLSSAPLQPIEQRFAFEPGTSISHAAPSVAAHDSSTQAWIGDLASPNGDAPASLPQPDQIADLKPLGQVSASFIIAVNGQGL